MKNILLLALAAFAFSSAQASDDSKHDHSPWLFLGIDGGLTSIKTNVSNEDNTSGSMFDAKVLGSYYWSHIVGDAGVGWLYNRSSRDNVTIRTRAGFLEVSPRYRLGEHWQLGATGEYVFGTDLSFSETVGEGSSAFFIGPHVAYEFSLWDHPFRVTGRALLDSSTSPRQVIVFQVGLQMGFPFGHPHVAVEPTPAPRPRATPQPTPEVIPVKEPDVKVNLSISKVHFDTGSSELKGRSLELLHEIGAYLGKNADVFEKVVVSGHTDNRGSHALNLKLSNARAFSVKKALVEGGVPAEKVASTGYSFDRPIDHSNNEKAWAQNRRVELGFYGVSDPKLVESGIEKIKDNVGSDN